jgi:hypothetical protein
MQIKMSKGIFKLLNKLVNLLRISDDNVNKVLSNLNLKSTIKHDIKSLVAQSNQKEAKIM